MQHFLLLVREHDGSQLWNSMLLMDLDGQSARRVAIASLGIDWFEPRLLGSTNPQRKLLKLI
ncbi:hypothetical protein BS17DRAFT_788835 [Gyrodon lividus]|nr:hypothetical protein BS17DRAFT_788835 [Gyrodon lividus]